MTSKTILANRIQLDRLEFGGSEDAAERKGIDPRIKLTAEFRVIAYGIPFDALKKNQELSLSTAWNSLISSKNLIVTKLGKKYLRVPIELELIRIVKIMESRGFPVCMGSLACQDWNWKSFSVAWAGQFQGKLRDRKL